MANSNGWGDGAANNAIGWGQGANNNIGWGKSHSLSSAGLTDIVGLTTDSDAQAFITAAAITDATQQSAIDTLVKGLKTDGIWTKMKAIYPFVGGTASTHKYNLKDPRDLDAAFRLVFNGGWTHSSTGATPNGTNGYADTKLNPSISLASQNSSHMSYYSRTNNDGTYIEMGSNIDAKRIVLHVKYNGDAYYDQNDQTSGGRLSFSMAAINSSCFSLMSRTANNLQIGQVNGINKGINTNTMTSAMPNANIYVGAFNNSTLIYTNRQCAFSSIGDGLTDTESANLYTRVQAYQTALSRQV